jgi:nucleoid-associated protein YgaU
VSTQHVVAPGEHLWGIAAAHLAARSGREASALAPEEIAPYWTRLCMVNAERLRSRDPNLVHPGEVVQLPAL